MIDGDHFSVGVLSINWSSQHSLDLRNRSDSSGNDLLINNLLFGWQLYEDQIMSAMLRLPFIIISYNTGQLTLNKSVGELSHKVSVSCLKSVRELSQKPCQ